MSLFIEIDYMNLPKQPDKEYQLVEKLIEYSGMIFNICLGFLKNPWEAEELTQDVYLHAMRKLNSLRKEDKLKQWLFRITRNTCLNHIRKERLRRILLYKENDAVLEKNNSEWQLIYKEQYQSFKNAVSHLPYKKRIVFVFREYGDLSYQEIADIIGIKKGTVMSRLNRAREVVIAQLKEGDNERSK